LFSSFWLITIIPVTIIIALIFVTIGILTTVYSDKIAADLAPAGAWLKARPYGFIIPIAVLVIVSFPPLFGHDLVALVVGDFYGLWVGFAILAGGTLIGEVLNFL
jgi:uncharacterized membrane protein YdjX (TVP38/TMEM64 family)